MLKITAPRLVKNLREDVDWMDCISRQEDDFTECSFNGLCVEDVSKQNLSVNSCLFTNCGFIACNIVNLSLAMWYLRTVTYQI